MRFDDLPGQTRVRIREQITFLGGFIAEDTLSGRMVIAMSRDLECRTGIVDPMDDNGFQMGESSYYPIGSDLAAVDKQRHGADRPNFNFVHFDPRDVQ